MVIVGERPFSPDVSNPVALEMARGIGHIEMGDLEQLAKGGYNGLVDVLPALLGPILLGPVLGSVAKDLQIPKASIDPRYGGAAIMGSQLAQDLALEAVAAG